MHRSRQAPLGGSGESSTGALSSMRAALEGASGTRPLLHTKDVNVPEPGENRRYTRRQFSMHTLTEAKKAVVDCRPSASQVDYLIAWDRYQNQDDTRKTTERRRASERERFADYDLHRKPKVARGLGGGAGPSRGDSAAREWAEEELRGRRLVERERVAREEAAAERRVVGDYRSPAPEDREGWGVDRSWSSCPREDIPDPWAEYGTDDPWFLELKRGDYWN